MAFNFFRKKETTPVVAKTSPDEESFTAEQLDKVDGGYQKTQDDINKILAESEYINEYQKNELNDMLSDDKEVSEPKSYQK